MADQAKSAQAQLWQIPLELAGARLDAFLRRVLPHLSRRRLMQAIAEDLFTINGQAARKGDLLAGGDSVAFRGPASWLEAAPIPEPTLEVPVVYEDEFLIAVNKPAGMATHGFSARDRHTLANFLVGRFPLLRGIGSNRWEPGILHRLDAETSGLVVSARTPPAFENIREQFRRRRVVKLYWALVWGAVDSIGAIDFPIAHDPGDRTKMLALTERPRRATKMRTWPALTRYRSVSQRKNLSLVELRMETGVTHQLRVHLAAIGHPIVGDRLYGAPDSNGFGLSRHFLHAKELILHHPRDGRELRLEAPLAAELNEVLARLEMED